MKFEREKDDFQRDGYVVIRQLLPENEFRILTQNIERYIRDVVPTLDEVDAFYQDRRQPETLKQLQGMEQDEFFDSYRGHRKWIEVAETLLDERVVALGPEWFNKPPGTDHPTPAHQDNYYFNLKPANVLSIWMAMDRVDADNGCLRYLPGSHHHGVRPHQATLTLGFSQGVAGYTEEESAREVPIFLDAGDVVVHHGNTIHSAMANISATRHRPAFAMVVKGVSCRRDEEGFARYQAAATAQREALT